MTAHDPATSANDEKSRNPRICTREACDTCRDKKAKCDGGKPCSRCDQRNLNCVYESRNYRTKRSLRDEIASLKRRNKEQDDLIEELQQDLEQEQGHDQKHDRDRPILLSPRSSTVGAHDHRPDSTSSPSSQPESPIASIARRVPDAKNAFVDLNTESNRMANDLLQAESTVSAQGVPVLNMTNGPPDSFDGSFCLPWDAFQSSHDASYPVSDTQRNMSFASDVKSSSQEFMPMFTMQNGAPLGMDSTMVMPQMHTTFPWNDYQPPPPEAASVPPVYQPTTAASTAPTPPLSPSFVETEKNSAKSPKQATPTQPATRERHRLASARNWNKKKSAAVDLQATELRVEAQHKALQTQYAEVAEQVRSVKHALLDHASCDDPAIGRWLQQEARQVGGSMKAEGDGRDDNDNGKRAKADDLRNASATKSRKQGAAEDIGAASSR